MSAPLGTIRPEVLRVVALIALQADSGCHYCGAELLRHLDATFPGHRAVLLSAWQEVQRPFHDEGETGEPSWEDDINRDGYGGEDYWPEGVP